MKWPQYFGRYNPTGKIYHKAPVYINKKGLFLFVNQKGVWSANDKVNDRGLLRGTATGKDGNCVAFVTDWEVWDIHYWRSANITVSCIKGNRETAYMTSTQSIYFTVKPTYPFLSHLSNRMSIIEEEGLPHSPGNSLPHQGEAVSSLLLQNRLALGKVVLLYCNIQPALHLHLSSDCHDVPAYQLKCPGWKVKHGCSDVRIPGWSDSINSLCPKTCGICGNIIIFSALDSAKYF